MITPNRLSISPIQLDKQSPIKIDKWLSIGSEEYLDKDPDPGLTKKFLRAGVEGDFLFTDSMGRIWGRNAEQGYYYPFHFDYGKKLYGFRLPMTAAN